MRQINRSPDSVETFRRNVSTDFAMTDDVLHSEIELVSDLHRASAKHPGSRFKAHGLSPDRHDSASKRHSSSSEAQISSSELHHSSSELETSPSTLHRLSFEVRHVRLDRQILSSNLQRSGYQLDQIILNAEVPP